MDFVITVPRLPQVGETVLGESFVMKPGGKGANQAVAASRLSAEVFLVSRVGADDVGKRLLENLVRSNRVNMLKYLLRYALVGSRVKDKLNSSLVSILSGREHGF